MPNLFRIELLEEPENATIQELCTEAKQKLISRELCPVDDWSTDGFKEMSTDNSGKFLAVVTKMAETQSSPENRINSWSEKNSQPQQGTSDQNTRQNFSNQQKWRGYSRGRFNKKRGNRGYYKNPGSNIHQN